MTDAMTIQQAARISSMAKGNGATAEELDGGNPVHRLVLQELDLVEIIASRIVRAVGVYADREELVAAGREGLLEAATRFDPTRSIPFRAYANIRIQGAIIDSIRKTARLPRRVYERLRALEVSNTVNAGVARLTTSSRSEPNDDVALENALATQLEDGATAILAAIASTDGFGGSTDPEASLAQNPEDAAQQAELVRALHAGIALLDDDEAMMIRMSYFEGASTRQVARQLGVSDSWCFRLLKSGTMRLTRYMQTYKTTD